LSRIQYILRDGDNVVTTLDVPDGSVPAKGDDLTIHSISGDPTHWVVEGVHRELWPGPSNMRLSGGRPLSVPRPTCGSRASTCSPASRSDLVKRPLADIPDHELREEIRRRETARLAGCCDYCERPPSEPVCAHPERHVTPDRPRAKEGFTRLVAYLRDHPDVLSDLVDELGIPVPRCDGHGGCNRPVLWRTPSQQWAEYWSGRL